MSTQQFLIEVHLSQRRIAIAACSPNLEWAQSSGVQAVAGANV